MTNFLWPILVFLGAYTLNLLYVSVFYHRALTHCAIEMHPYLKKFVIHTGNWITGLDPKAWVCMHRLHHQHADTPKDPHSPVTNGIWRVLPLQLYSYKRTIVGLLLEKPYYTEPVKDLDFSISFLNKKRLWYLPYLLQLSIAIILALLFHSWILAAAYWLGMMSHPIQGWMVNALGHRFGYRNYETPDNSTNNTIVAWLVFGEGYQNNHHHRPPSPKFSVKSKEVDLGYGLCLALLRLGLLRIPGVERTHLVPH